MIKYEPEAGQVMFGCPASEYECPELIIAGLAYLAREIERVEWNRTQKQYEAPIYNNAEEYKTDVFEMHAYYWGDDETISNSPNFKCGDFEVRWYKYLGRGTSCNNNISPNEFAKILSKCLASVRQRNIKLW